MNLLEEVKKNAQNLSLKLKGNDNYLTSSLVLAATAVVIVVGILIATLLKPAFLPKNLQNQFGYNQVPTNTPTPTPTPIPLPRGPREYGISNKYNPQLRSFRLSEFAPKIGEKQELTLKALDQEGGEITSINIKLTTDHKTRSFQMNLISGTKSNGEWSVSWNADDTHDYRYNILFEAVNNKGQKASVNPMFR